MRTTVEAIFWDSSGTAGAVPTTVYDRDRLRAGNVVDGPAIIEQFDSTTIVGPGQRAVVDRVGHLVISTGAAREDQQTGGDPR
ncbi:N-methylhydantoinase A/oxoprolinase/acetone carboxylase beta subunit [Pseudonocardia antarctica]|uniref:N-methylhydantoinase A/oxoprolinase/acetone carboxylase beta subunit n=1 Tax=Pseudonocardia alni TaxID=33907 RepID=A0A852W5Q6_PSEA5|nr:N-methylhydantoinase A/oxoprolinase/acetone carboxylase beta subunit [Pseudonocardia antarctica]